jgi:hypothetical protein
MRLVHSRGDLGLFLCSDLLERRGDGGRIIELGQLGLPEAVQVQMVFDIGHQIW